jgi:putative spermidine/putrescine transport system ATP-binding protein
MTTKIELLDLRKVYDKLTVVSIQELTIRESEFVCLLGPSGCGKTTTMRMIAGLIRPTSGDIRINGQSILDIPPEKRNIAMVFQNYVLFPHMNVAQNVGFGLKMRRVPQKEIDRRVEEVLGLVRLEDMGHRFPKQLSGGQQQRVALARAIIVRPRMLLMDEPLANLDAKLREEMRAFIRGLQRQLQITTLFVTHDQSEAITLADRIGVMFDAKIHQYDTPAMVFEKPASQRVADFMGATNFISGCISQASNGVTRLDTVLGPLELGYQAARSAGEEVSITIRPEHLQLRPGDRATRPNEVAGKVREAVFHGGTIHYYVEAGTMTLHVTSLSNSALTAGDAALLYFDPAQLWLFPQHDVLQA